MNFSRLRSNPFPVKAWFDSSCTLTFAVPATEIASRLPRGLEPDCYEKDGKSWGFIAVAAVQTRQLRPAFFPKFLGNDFILLGYRYFVRYRSHTGRQLRGLYILRSETDQARMTRLGNCFTQYRYSHQNLQIHQHEHRLQLTNADTGLRIQAEITPEAALPDCSPFPVWKSARRFCGPMPFTFSIDSERNHVSIVEGQRSHWQPAPIRIIDYHIPWLDTLDFSQITLANAFIVRDVPYHWKRGRIEPLPPHP